MYLLKIYMLRDNALCLFGFKDKGRLTQTVVNLFAESSTQMVRNSLNVAKSEIKERLAAVGQAIEDIPGLQQIFDEDSSAMNPLRGIETEQKQHQYNLNHFNLVVSLFYALVIGTPTPEKWGELDDFTPVLKKS